MFQVKLLLKAMGSSILDCGDQAKAGSIIKMLICLRLISSHAEVLRLRCSVSGGATAEGHGFKHTGLR